MLNSFNTFNLKKTFFLFIVSIFLFGCPKGKKGKNTAKAMAMQGIFSDELREGNEDKDDDKKIEEKISNIFEEYEKIRKKDNEKTKTSKNQNIGKTKNRNWFSWFRKDKTNNNKKSNINAINKILKNIKNETIIIIMHGMGSKAEAIKKLPYNICKKSNGELKLSNVLFICRDTGKLRTFKNNDSNKLIDINYYFSSNIKNNNKIKNQAAGLTQLLTDLNKINKVKKFIIISHSISGTITLKGTHKFCKNIKNQDIKFHLIFVNAALSGIYFPRNLPDETLAKHNLLCTEFNELKTLSNKEINNTNKNLITQIYQYLGSSNLKITVTASTSNFLEGCRLICNLKDESNRTKDFKSELGIYHHEKNQIENQKIQEKAKSQVVKYKGLTDGTLFLGNMLGGKITNQVEQKLSISISKTNTLIEENSIFSNIQKKDSTLINYLTYENLDHTNFQEKFSKSLQFLIRKISDMKYIRFLAGMVEEHKPIINIFFKKNQNNILASQQVAEDICKKILITT